MIYIVFREAMFRVWMKRRFFQPQFQSLIVDAHYYFAAHKRKLHQYLCQIYSCDRLSFHYHGGIKNLFVSLVVFMTIYHVDI